MDKNVKVVLVHGAWADASSWSKVITLLHNEGYSVSAVQLPLTSLEEDIEITKRSFRDSSTPIVLVGHSYGGAVITGAATDAPQVKALVYITAFGLDQGESLDSLSKQGPAPAGAASVAPDAYGFLWINKSGFHQAFAADVSEEEAFVMATVQRPLSVVAFAGVEGVPAWKTVPSWYLHCTNDHMIPPPAQEFMAKRMGATIHSIPSSHSPFMSRPNDVASIIELAAASVSK